MFRTNNRSNNQIFVSIIHIIRPRLADVGSNYNGIQEIYLEEAAEKHVIKTRLN